MSQKKKVQYYLNQSVKQLLSDRSARNLLGTSSGGGGLTQVYTTNSLSITWSGTGTQIDPLIATAIGSGSSPANPTALLGLTAINGSALTFMRSDAAPALNQGIAPTWTGLHLWQPPSGGGGQAISILHNNANISFYDTANTTRSGYLQIRTTDGLMGTSLATPFSIFTNATNRITFGAAGGWNIGGSEGTSGQVITSNGAGAPPTWQTQTVTSTPTLQQVTTAGATTDKNITINNAVPQIRIESSGSGAGLVLVTGSNGTSFNNDGSSSLIILNGDSGSTIKVNNTADNSGRDLKIERGTGTITNTVFADGRMSGTNATNNNEFTTKVQIPTLALQSQLTGLAPLTSPIGSTDTIISAFGKTQGQIDLKVSLDAVTNITSGSSSTVPNGTNIIRFNPASVISTYTLTLPTTWHTSNDLLISFGGTITSGNPVVTTLVIVAGSGQTLLQSASPSTGSSGEIIRYHLIGTIDQRTN